jgi:hypothetical protein
MPICLSAWNYLPPSGWVFMKFNILIFFENLFGKFKFDFNLARITGSLRED